MIRRCDALALLALFLPLVLCVGCKCGLPFIGAGCFELEVRGENLSELKALYVGLGDLDQLREPMLAMDVNGLVGPEAQQKYESFVQYGVSEVGGAWEQVASYRTSEFVEHEFQGLDLDVMLKRALLKRDEGRQYGFVLLANYGSQGWKLQEIARSELEGKARKILTVQLNSLSLRDGG